jgi:N-acylneuraminate cytidylyltransferase
MRIAVIPARGGSKRIPGKNIKLFRGKPIIAWSIEAAIASDCFDKIIVSTDDKEIAAISKLYGAQVPFTRPAHISDDFATTIDVIAHAATWAVAEGWELETICCIYATAPLVSADDLLAGLEALKSPAWDYAFSVTDYAAPVFRSFKQADDGGLAMLYPEHQSTRSQDLPRIFHDAGQFYWGKRSAWLDRQPVFGHKSFPIFVPRWRVQDIDTPEDWLRAELIAAAALAMA